MGNKILISIISVLLLLGVGFAYYGNNHFDNMSCKGHSDDMNHNHRNDMQNEMVQNRGSGFHKGDMKDDMENIFENGTYSDLVKLREDTNSTIAYWVNNEKDFQQLKQNHNDRENEMGQNMGRGFHGGCMG